MQRPECPKVFSKAAEIVRRLGGIVVAHHVVGKHHVALPSHIDALDRGRIQRLILQPAIIPVPVWNQHGRMPSRGPGAIEIPAKVVAWNRLQLHLLDGVTVPFNAAEHHRMQRCFLRHRQKSGGRKDLFPQLQPACLPFGQRTVRRHGEMRVGIGRVGVANVLVGNSSEGDRSNEDGQTVLQGTHASESIALQRLLGIRAFRSLVMNCVLLGIFVLLLLFVYITFGY